MTHKEIITPFNGYYESVYSDLIDDINELDSIAIALIEFDKSFDCEFEATEFLTTKDIDIIDYNNEYQEKIDFKAMREALNKIYIQEFIELFNSYTGLNITLNYKCMESPKYYNYSTDKLVSTINDNDIKVLYKHAKDYVANFNEVIKERFTSHDGFISSYSNDVNEWLQKDCLNYDHNELETLLISAISCKHNYNDFLNEVFEQVQERCSCNGELETIIKE